ncbi:MAG: hypothetical protein HY675_03515 [Chloroflexi bacterium]|nr:hypothetical protein [Chloroflexota bacterium]
MVITLAFLILAIVLATASYNRPVALVGLGLHYVATGVLLGEAAGIQIGLERFVVGAVVCAAIWLAIAGVPVLKAPRRLKPIVRANPAPGAGGTSDIQAPPTAPPPDPDQEAAEQPRQELATTPFFRLATIALCLIGAVGLAQNYPLAGSGEQAPLLNFAWYSLVIAGAFATAITRDPLALGIGLLLVFSGTEFAYAVWTAATKPNLLAVLAAIHLVLALLISYLVRASVGPPEASPEADKMGDAR